jgi:pilus retraction protein PilT
MAEFIDALADHAFESGAIDLFLAEDQVPRMRIDGDLEPIGKDLLDFETIASFWKRCGVDPDTEMERDLSYQVPDGKRLRVNLYHSLGNLAAVLRPIEEVIPTYADLGIPQDLLTPWLQRRSGLVLVTGPTGSGKSTTLAASLQWINENQKRHIITLEDPVEYLFANDQSFFSQREIRSDTENFANALRASLRQSPDVILLGEIRDEETALIALQAAETGHLVLATLHCSGVNDTIERLIHLFDSKNRESALNLLAMHLIGIVSQQLLPRKAGGLFVALEHMENQGATRKWIRDQNYGELGDHIGRGDSPQNCSFLRYLVAATEQDIVEEEVARSAAPNAQDYDRAIRGLS